MQSAERCDGYLYEMKCLRVHHVFPVCASLPLALLGWLFSGEMVSRAFTYTASIFKDTVVDFAQVTKGTTV